MTSIRKFSNISYLLSNLQKTNGYLDYFTGLDAVKTNNHGESRNDEYKDGYDYLLKNTLNSSIDDFMNFLNNTKDSELSEEKTRNSAFENYLHYVNGNKNKVKYSGYLYRMQGIDAVEKIIAKSSDKKQTYKNILAILKEVKSIYGSFDSNFTIAGSNYNGNSNDLYTQAAAYEKFYDTLTKNKENQKISMYTDKMQVNFNSKLNAYVVGPIMLDYYAPNYNFARATNFYLEVDGTPIGKQHKYTDGKIEQALPYDKYALVDSNMNLCGNEKSNLPAPKQEFYVVFTAGKGQNQITQLGFTYEYLAHESQYMFYKLYYGTEDQPASSRDMQDLAEAHSAHLWWQPTDLRIEFDIPRSLTIEKIVKEDNNCNKTFYFKVYDQAVTDESIEELVLNDGTKTGARLYKTIAVKAGQKETLDLLPYKKSEYEGKEQEAPATYIVEVDARGHRFIEYGEWDCFEKDSIWRDYIPEDGTGIYGPIYCKGNVSVERINTPIEKHFHLSVDKKILKNDEERTFFAKLDLTKNDNTETYILRLKPGENSEGYDLNCPDRPNWNGMYVCDIVDKGTGNFGTVKTWKDEFGYVHAEWSAIIDGYSSDEVSYKVEEVDENFNSYSKEEAEKDGSFWSIYSATYKNASGKLEACIGNVYANEKGQNILCSCNGNEEEQKYSNAVITNKKDDKIDVNLELIKEVVNNNKEAIPSEDIYKFEITLLKSEKEISYDDFRTLEEEQKAEGNILEKQTISVKADGKTIEKYQSKLYPLNGNHYYLIMEEKGNDAKWIDVQSKNNDWKHNWNQVKNGDTIEKLWTEIDLNNKEFAESIINKNVNDNEGTFSINKIIENVDNVEEYFENEENKYREFIFEVQSNRPLYTENLSEVFEQSDIDNGFVKINEETGKINIIINQDNYKDGVKTKPITWKANQGAPKIDIYEIDEHNNTYLAWTELGANRPKESVWNVFKPKSGGNGGHEQFLLIADENVHVDFVNEPDTIDKNFTLTKIVDGAWDNDDVFYFRILSLDGTKTNVVEKYFNEEDITTINGQRVVKIAKGEDNENKVTVTSKTITWKEIEENPQFWITEVDQYGEAWSKAPKHDDSIWNYYTPEYYGTWTCQLLENLDLNLSVEAKNTSNQVTLKKVIETEGEYTTEQFFKEFSEADEKDKPKFRFKFYDEKGNDLTKTYFETDKEGYIVIDENNYKDGVTSKPIAASKGNTFMFIESTKNENLYEMPKTLMVYFDDDNRIVEADYINKVDKRLVIDKVVEGATEDDFLDYEKFYFKVKENGKDVTNDLFETETVVVDKTAHDNGGVPSKIIYGNHTYEIIEYDKDGRDYEHKGDSEFWKNFEPENDGKWTVSLDATKGPSFVNAVNYVIGSITVEKEVVGDNITEADKNQKFPATVVIWSSEDSKDTDWFEVEGTRYSKNSTDKNKVVFVKQVEVSANEPVIIDGIICKGKAPTYQVYENIEDLPTNWDFVGHRVNGEFKPESSPYELEFKTNASMFDNDVSESDTSEIDNTNTIVIQNEKDSIDMRFFVEKTMLDQNGIPTTSEVDRTFYFDVYVEPTNAKYDGMDIEAIAKDENYNPGYYDENGKYIRIDRLEVFIPKGSVHGETYSKVIKGNEVNYKVVEVDEAGHKFGDKECTEDSLWKKFEPTMFSNGKWGNREGVWKGILDGSNPTTSTAKIDAYNKITKVTIDLEKWVWFENKLQEIEPDEEFKFIAEFEYKYENSNQGGGSAEEILITYEEQNWSETFELERGETIKYTITEVDPDNNVTYDEYSHGEESKFWKQFTPADSNGVITGTVDGSTANINLIGKNIKNVHSWLVITKDVSTKWLEEEEFEFKVFDGDKDVTKDLFEGAGNFLLDENGDVVLDEEGNPIDLYNSETNTIKLTYTTRTVYSNEVIWQSGTKAPTYTVKEVAYDKNKYKEPKDHDVTLKANEMETELTIENASRVAGYVGFINEVGSDFDRFSIEKIVEQNNLSMPYDETFYVIVKEMNGDIEGDNVLTQEDHIFTSEGKDYIDDGETKYTEVELNNGELAIELKKDQKAVSRIISWKKSETAPKYRIIEVDKYGNTFKQGSENSDSIWNNGYTPKNGTGIYDVQLVGQDSPNVEPTQVKVVNAIDDEPTNITITKVIKTSNGNSDIIDGENFYFKVEKSKGKTVEDVTKIFFDEKTLTNKNDETGEVEGLVHLHVGNKNQNSKDVYLTQGYTYTVIETDQYGEPYDKNKDYTNTGSIWEEYIPSDDIGKWEISKNQTEVIAENEKTIKHAELRLTKHVDGSWDDGKEYAFNIYINGEKEEVTLSKTNQSWSTEVTWKADEKAPEVSFEEPENINVEITINGNHIAPKQIFTLSDEDNMSYTFTAVNHIDINDKEANFTIIKKAPSGDDEYKFGYAYSFDNGAHWTNTYEINVKANSPGKQTEIVKWNQNDPTPLFKVWEISEGLKSITATNTEYKTIEENGKKGLQGNLNPDTQVTVNVENDTTHSGGVYVVKEFADSELKDKSMTDILKEVKAYYKEQGKYEFEFNLKIYYENPNDKFIYNDEERNELIITESYDIDYMIENYSEEGIEVISPEYVSWSGESAPKFTVTEKSKVGGKEIKGCFFEGQVIEGTAVQLVDKNEPIKVRVINNYDHFTKIHITLITSLAGDVWIDNKVDGKTITSNSKKDEGETAASNVYVVPYRCLVDKDNNIIEVEEAKKDRLGINSANNKFILNNNDETFYYYIAEGQDDPGHWKFENVKITAFDLEDETELGWYNQGYKLKYYVEFYYDGMEYEAVKELVDGSANDYIQLNPEKDEDLGFKKYFDNSTAAEVDREKYNSKYATVEGRDIMDPETGKSTGAIWNADHKEMTTTVDYSTKIIGNLNTNVIRTTTTGDVNTKKLDEINTIDDLINNFMCSSTKATEGTPLLYFFLNEFDGVDVEAALGDKEININGSPKRDGIARDTRDGKDKVKFVYDNPVRVDYVPVEYAQHINLGLIKREKAEVQIDKKIETATVIINDKKFTYSYNNTVDYKENFTEALEPFIRDVTKANELYKVMQNDVKKNEKELNIYTSDYYYRTSMYNGTEVKDALDAFYNAIYQTVDENGNIVPDAIKTRELQIYLTYSITVLNNSGKYAVRINSIDDYYDSRLTFVDVGQGYAANADGIENFKDYEDNNGEKYGPGLWAYIKQDEKEEIGLTNVLTRYDSEDKAITEYYTKTFTGKDITGESAINNEVNKMTFEKEIYLTANGDLSSEIFYVTYRVNDVQFDYRTYIDPDGTVYRYTPPYNNVAEIASFTPYLDNDFTKYAAVIDEYSAPGNYNITDETTKNYMEFDTDLANVQFYKKDGGIEPERTISGTAWLENKEDSDDGKGKLTDKDYRISGLNTKLVEVIDLPIRKVEDGNFEYNPNNYTEYEFYWKVNETTTDKDGKYTFKSYIDSSNSQGNEGVNRNSLVPGNYVVRFFYGDKDTGLYDKDGNEIDNVIRINGEDYKTTAYEIGDHNGDYIDNEWHKMKKADDTNRARDNEARRLKIIKDTQTLTNSNTAVFDIANYASAEAYAKAKTDQAMIERVIATEDDWNLYYDRQIETYTTYKKDLYGTSNEDGIKASEITNGSTAYEDLIYKGGYSMFADTAKMNLKVEEQSEKYGEDVTPEGISFNKVNLGLEERPRTKLYLDKQAEEITLTTSAGKTFFHVAYDFDYVVDNVDENYFENRKKPENENPGFEYNLIDYDKDDKLAVWVGLKPQGEVIGMNNLQALDDNMIPEHKMKITYNGEDTYFEIPQKAIIQGFRYINIDSTVLQGLKLDIRYRFTAINLSETDKYGIGLYGIMKDEHGENYTYIDRTNNFNDAIGFLSLPEYTLGSSDQLFFKNLNENDGPKKYGEYLGHTYYQGSDERKEDKIVTTKPRQIVDYIDNDIEFDLLANPTWATEQNDYEQLKGRVDEFVFVDGKVQNESEVEYKTIATSIDADTNEDFVKELKPINEGTTITKYNEDDEKAEPNKEGTAFIVISTSKLFAGTDKGNTGMDNFAEFFVIENTVGRRDVSVVNGNLNPRGGATTTTERDETATEIVTLSPPTGNEENDRTMLVVISIICTIALASGTAVGLKLKFSGKSKTE